MAKTAFGKFRKMMVSLAITMRTKKRVLKVSVWSVLLFGCEDLTISKVLSKRLEAAEMRFYRRMLRVR